MKLISYLQKEEDLIRAKEAGLEEVIIGTDVFSRFGSLTIDKANDLAKKCLALKIRPVFEWDVLMVQTKFEIIVPKLNEVDFNSFKAIRVQDPGAFGYILEHYPNLPIQLNLETGNHNLIGIQRWIDSAKERVERIILSIEFPKAKLEEYITKLKVSVEFLGLGRILLFYTPRSLLGPLVFDHDDSEVVSVHNRPIEVYGSSEESPHSGFPIIENRHGTFMFNIKDHCLLENFLELQQMNLAYCRIDLRFVEQNTNLLKDIQTLNDSFDSELAKSIKEKYPAKVIRGYYQVNKSDALFSKLKNKRTLRNDENYLGDILEVNKKKHLGLLIRNESRQLKVGDQIEIRTPDGKVKNTVIHELKNSKHESLEEASNGQVVFFSHVSGVSVKSSVYLA
ncbi:U32 family peptidase [Halobacteriovorax sp. GB3]|uniref:U32 family peptidase n=1 Tax=Halobacteriovorax sp. GB3 TaxID=2719615 RepID=UPI002360441B|nr:U32 family peptidase C-terminal domain-containing protein [Halobacteriovorax sp. GB3]MDD0853160.1 U32 family peptidase [Halobacteriovorax sp. GB3]